MSTLADRIAQLEVQGERAETLEALLQEIKNLIDDSLSGDGQKKPGRQAKGDKKPRKAPPTGAEFDEAMDELPIDDVSTKSGDELWEQFKTILKGKDLSATGQRKTFDKKLPAVLEKAKAYQSSEDDEPESGEASLDEADRISGAA